MQSPPGKQHSIGASSSAAAHPTTFLPHLRAEVGYILKLQSWWLNIR
nr:MAG TPA: hypothetical protein [Bacteriophage sp.]